MFQIPLRLRRAGEALALMGLLYATPYWAAQWIKYPTPGVPRKADRTVDMFAATPRLADGKPDFSGVWTTAEPNSPRPGVLTSSKEQGNTAAPVKEAETLGDPAQIRSSRLMANLGVESAKVREEMRRPDFGHLEIRATVDDPKAYTKPWTVTLKQRIVVDADLIDEMCIENERFFERIVR